MKKLVTDIKEVKEVTKEVETTEETKELNVAGTGEITIDLKAEITDSSVTVSNPVINDFETKKILTYDILGLLTVKNSMDAEILDPTIVSVTEVV